MSPSSGRTLEGKHSHFSENREKHGEGLGLTGEHRECNGKSNNEVQLQTLRNVFLSLDSWSG